MNPSVPGIAQSCVMDALDFRCIDCGDTYPLDDDSASCDACNVPLNEHFICIGCAYSCNDCGLEFCRAHIVIGDLHLCVACHGAQLKAVA